MRKLAILIAAGAAVASGTAAAKDIPVAIHWVGTQPANISQTVSGGFRSLDYDPQTKTFTGMLQITGDAPKRQTFTVSYGGGYDPPIDVRVHRFLDDIEFTIELTPAPSCTGRMVLAAGKPSYSIPHALRGALTAGQLLSIASPNDCSDDLAWDATQARYRQSVRLMQMSDGFFLINPQFADDYRKAADELNIPRQRRIDARAIEGEVSGYADQEARLEAVQMRIAREQAQKQEEFGLAASISEAMLRRTESDEAARRAYAKEGLPNSALKDDTAYLKNVADSRGQLFSQE